MKTEDISKRFTAQFKIEAVERMAAGANVAKLSRELGVSRKALYDWRKRFDGEGPAGLRGRDCPSPLARETGPEGNSLAPLPSTPDELAKALARIGQLERIIGQQTADLDFFQKALLRVAEERRRNDAPGGPSSTGSSKP